MPKNIIAGKITLGYSDKGQGGVLNEFLGFEKKKKTKIYTGESLQNVWKYTKWNLSNNIFCVLSNRNC